VWVLVTAKSGPATFKTALAGATFLPASTVFTALLKTVLVYAPDAPAATLTVIVQSLLAAILPPDRLKLFCPMTAVKTPAQVF
jgi:hypothetical protein